MYILAGKQKLAEARSTTLHELRAKAEASNLPEDAQAANDFENKCVRFEKKLHDLELTRMISLQTAPQIRMIQNNDTALVEKIQTSVLNTIPLPADYTGKKIHQLDASPIFAKAITRIYNETSISSLF